MVKNKNYFVQMIVVVASLIVLASATKITAAQSGPISQATLKEQAGQVGGRITVRDVSHHGAFFKDLHELAETSDHVITGEIMSNHCRLAADGKTITTDYVVSVADSLKGTLRPGTLIIISTPGGIVSFDQSTSALVTVPDFRRPKNGRTYLFFIDQKKMSGKYTVAGGFQGIFDITHDGPSVFVSDRRQDSLLFRQYNNMERSTFLRKAHEVTENR